MNPYTLPALLTSRDLETLLNVGRARLSGLRSGDPTFPDPASVISTPRKPRWHRRDVVRWMVVDGRLPEDALEPFEVPGNAAPNQQRWQLVGAEFVTVTVLNSPVELRVLRYDAINRADPRKVAVCVPVGTIENVLVANRISAESLTQLGYSEERGAVAWIVPATGLDRQGSRVFGATVDSNEQDLSMRLLEPEALAQLLGHPLPLWQRGAVSKAAAATWMPRPHELGPTPPVPAGTLPALAEAKDFREHCAEVIDQISEGKREAPENVPAQLARMGNTMWDAHVFKFDWVQDQPLELEPGWTLPIIPVLLSNDEPEPLLPVQPHSVDLFAGLEWLLGQEDLPEGMARTGSTFYGYPQSVGVIEIDLNVLPLRLRHLLDNAFAPIEPRTSWLHTALRRHIADPGHAQEPITVGWKTDPNPHAHPALIIGDRRVYHVPRRTLPISTPSAVHIVATGTGTTRSHAAFLADRAGTVVPIAIDPHSTTRDIACALAAVALGIEEPLSLPRIPVLSEAPDLLVRMTDAMVTSDHLEIDWATLTHVVGPRAPGLDDDALTAALSNPRTTPWREDIVNPPGDSGDFDVPLVFRSWDG